MHIGTSTTGPVSEEDVLEAAADVGLKKEQLGNCLCWKVAVHLRLLQFARSAACNASRDILSINATLDGIKPGLHDEILNAVNAARR